MTSIKKLTYAAVAAVSLAAPASAATIDFSTAVDTGAGARGSVAGSAVTYTVTAASSLFPATAAVSISGAGLGVSHRLDTQSGQIDGIAAGLIRTSEMLTITFSWAVNLVDFTLGRIDRGDDFEVSFDGINFTPYGPGYSGPTATFNGQNDVTTFSVRATGSNLIDADNFTLASADVSPVPLPAAGFLLLAGLAGLTGLRRRKVA